MADPKKIIDKEAQQAIFKKIGIIATAVLLATAVIPFIHEASLEFAKTRNKEKDINLRNIARYFNECTKQAEEGNFALARKNLLKIKPSALKPKLRGEWFKTMTNIYFKEARANPHKKSFLVINALNYAQRGIDSNPARETVDAMSKIKAELYLLNDQWQPAKEIFMKLEGRSTAPKDRWEYRMDAALCYKNLKMNEKAIQLLDSVIDETDEREIWAAAMRRKGDLYLSEADNEQLDKYTFKPDKPVIDQFIQASLKQFINTNKAQNIYQQVIKEISHNMHPEKIMCMVKLLDIYVQKGLVKEAYTTANAIKRSAADRPEAAAVYMNMAKLETRRSNLQRAASYIDHLITAHPSHPYLKIAFNEYYTKLKEHKQWKEAFELAHKIVQAPVSNSIRIEIIQDFHLGENKILQHIDMKVKENQIKANLILNSPSNPTFHDKEVILFGQASVSYATGDYYMADVLMSKYLREINYEKYREQAYYYYLTSAVDSLKPAVIRALRAKIYLNNTYDSQHSQNVMLYLMAAYYDMGMWEESIESAMKVFVNEIVKMGREKDDYKATNEWLKAVARIGQSYEKIGRKADASNIFDMWAADFKKSPYAASIYIDWAELASDKKQHNEALRRYKVIMPHVHDPGEFMELVCLSIIQKLKINGNKAREEAYVMLKKLPTKIDLLTEKKIDVLKRKIYKALLENSLDHDQGNLESLFTKILEIYKEDYWPYIFIIKWLRNNIDSPDYKSTNQFFQAVVSGPLSALKKDKVKKAIVEQAKMLTMLEKENIF